MNISNERYYLIDRAGRFIGLPMKADLNKKYTLSYCHYGIRFYSSHREAVNEVLKHGLSREHITVCSV